MKQILGVIDLSEASVKVLELAARIAVGGNANLLVIYPYRLIDSNHSGDWSTLKESIERAAREKFQILTSQVPKLEQIPFEFHPEIGFVADRIHAHMRRKNIDMVVIGKQQVDAESDIRESNLHRLISSSRPPFVIVPAQAAAEASL